MIRLGTSGVDNLTGGTGDDIFFMTANNFVTDTVNGAGGIDKIDYGASQVGVQITLTGPATKGGVAGGTVEADFLSSTYNPATGTFIQMNHHQVLAKLTSIENAVGSNYNDVLKGNGFANTLNGGAGNDVIDGGGSNDTIIGGAGVDTMTGGTGSDTFVFQHAYDGPMSPTTYTSMDTITDFVHGSDKIDLRALVSETAGNHALSFIDTAAYTGVAGQINMQSTGYGWLMKVDLDGDRDADFQAMVHGTDYEMHQHFQTSDFILA